MTMHTNNKKHICLNGYSKYSARVPTYSGVLGTYWFKEAFKGVDAKAIKEEAIKRDRYIGEIRQEKIDIILKNKLELDTVYDNILHFKNETDTEIKRFEFYAYPSDYDDIEARLGKEIFRHLKEVVA